jgi:hypothetical protein
MVTLKGIIKILNFFLQVLEIIYISFTVSAAVSLQLIIELF